MAEDTSTIRSPLEAIRTASDDSRGKKRTTNNEALGQADFLKLLVEQLKSQDPLNPMENEQFAVNLAQFSQLEQLIKINDKVGAASVSDVSGLAGFLGNKVTLSTDTLEVSGGNAPELEVTLPRNTVALNMKLTDVNTGAVTLLPLSGFRDGPQALQLQSLNVPNGSYRFELKAETSSGVEVPVAGNTTGVVTGFIPGAEPRLILGNSGTEVTLDKVVRVDVESQP
jgi:flagellar basal-body rod modification protein FlgD